MRRRLSSRVVFTFFGKRGVIATMLIKSLTLIHPVVGVSPLRGENTSTDIWAPFRLAHEQLKPSVVGVSLTRSLFHVDESVPHQFLMLVCLTVGVPPTRSRQCKHQPTSPLSISPWAVEILRCGSVPYLDTWIVTLLMGSTLTRSRRIQSMCHNPTPTKLTTSLMRFPLGSNN